MKKVVLFLVLLLWCGSVQAYTTSATSSILMDIDHGKIFHSNNIHAVRSVASISKIMTCIVAIESNKLNDTVIIGDEINESFGSGIYIKEGEEITLESLLYGLMLRSGNDAALAIAKYVGGDVKSFVQMMNDKAKDIGMKNSVFNNPSGLDNKKGNLSTAYDMALLTSYAMNNPIFRKIISTKKYELQTNLNYYVWNNKNKLLLSTEYITGGKTGYTEKARRTLVTTASKNNINLVAVTLNDGNDFADHLGLYEEVFDIYQGYQILKKGKINILNEEYYNNDILKIKKDFYYPLNDNEKNNVVLKFELTKKRGYENDDEVGKVKIMIDDNVIHEEAIYVSKVIEKKASFIKRMIKWVNKLW